MMLPTLHELAAAELEGAGGDRTKAIAALVRRLLDDEVLREGVVAPILNNIVEGTISTAVYNRRGAR
jgi:hypothetical protein